MEDELPQAPPPLQPAPSTAPVIGSLDAASVAAVMHIAGMFFGFVPGLVVYLMKSDDPFLRHHSAQAINLHVTSLLGFLVAAVLIFVLIGFFLFFAIIFGALLVQVVAAMAAKRGEYYQIPLTLQIVS